MIQKKTVGEKHHKYSYGYKEYILAVLNLCQDIINLSIQVMNILNKVEKNGNREYILPKGECHKNFLIT